MASAKIWIKLNPGSTFSEVKRIFVKKDPNTIWERVTKIWAKTTTGLWSLVFSNANLPLSSTSDPISLRYNSYTGPKVTTSYAYIGGATLSDYYLYGHDGAYTNYTSITDRKFVYAYPTVNDTQWTLESDDILNTQSNMQVAENCYVWYQLKVWNGSDPFNSVVFQAPPVYMIKQSPSPNSYPSIGGTQAVNNTISMTYNYSNKWYESPDQANSYVAWYRSTDGYTLPGVTSSTDVGNPQKISYFTDATTNNSTSIQGALTYSITSADVGYYLVARTVVQNSNTVYFSQPIDYRVATTGKIGTPPPTNSSLPYFQLIGGTANTIGATYRFYPGTWNNPATGTTLQYKYILDLNNAAGTNLWTYPSTTTFTSNTYYDYTFQNSTTNSLAFYVQASNGSDSDYAYAQTSLGPISNVFTQGTISVSGGSSSTYADTGTRDVSNGSTLTVNTSGWPSGTVFTYQWWKSRDINELPPLALGTSSSQSVSTLGEYYYCVVSWSNPNYPSNGSGSTTTDSYTVVPALPSFTLTNNADGSFKISNVSSSGAGYYSGTYTYGGNTYTIPRTAIGTDSNFTVGANTVSVTIYGVAYIGGVLNRYYTGWESTTSSVSVTSQSVYQSTGSMRRVTMPIAFTGTSQTVWVGTNGYVSTTLDPTTSPGTSWPSAGGVVVGPFVADLKQTSLSYKADASNFYVYWQGTALNDATQTVAYLMKFYWSSTTVDVYFVTNNLTTVTPSSTAIQYGNSNYQLWSASTSITGMSIPSGMTSDTTNNGVDDNRTAITAGYNVAPSISGSYISPSSGTAGSTTFTAYAGTVTGTPTPTITYQWQYLNTSFAYVNVSGATSQSYTPPSNFNTLYPNYGFYCLITATNSVSSATDRPTATLNTPVSAPSGGTVSISTNTGNYSVGSVITYSTSGWSGSPTSYYLELHNGTNPVLTSDPLRASTTSTSGTYTITSSDVPNYFKAWATATNSGGSTQAASSQVGPAYTPVSPPSGGSVTLSGTAAVGQTLTATTSGWTNSPTSYDTRIVRGTAGVIISETLKASSTTSSVSYTVTSSDVGYYFKGFASATNSGGTSAFAASSEKGPVPASGTAPATPTGGGGTYSSGTNYVSNATFTSSASGTTPITYYWSVYSSTTSGGASTGYTNSGTIISSSLSTTLNIPQQSWNQATYGSWANYQVYASNSYGNSGTLTWAV